MLYKTTNRLFKGIYQYKIVLVVPGASLFRNCDFDSILKGLNKVAINLTHQPRFNSIKNKEDLDYAYKLYKHLQKISHFEIRVESPFISIYTNVEADINSLAKLEEHRVKYICKPPKNSTLETATIIMPKMAYDYRVTLGKTTTEHSAFIQWAESNSKIKLTKSCIRELSRDRSWGGTHFYVTGDNNLLLTKMHLGTSINKVERIVKA
jgi:hypothetical protein